jgi:hypothetical protein
MVAAAPADVLLDAMPFAVVEEPCLAGGARRRVLPAREPPFSVVGEGRAGGAAACAGGDAGGRATGHIAAGVVAGGVGAAARANGGRRVQMGASAVGVAAEWASGQSVERSVTKVLWSMRRAINEPSGALDAAIRSASPRRTASKASSTRPKLRNACALPLHARQMKG